MAAAAGARRTDTALSRLEMVTRAQDAMVFTSQVGDYHPDWRALEQRPEVAQLAVWDLMFGNIAGQPGGLLFVSHDGNWLGNIDRPVVIQGRMFDSRADEMVVDEQTAAANHVHVGSVVPFEAFAPSQTDPTATPTGPSFRIRVVGIVRDVDQFLFASAGLVSPGVVTHYGDRILLHPNAVVRLTHGEADVAALRRDVNALVAPGVPVLDLDNASRRVTTTLAVERFALAMLALAIAAAGSLIVLQVLFRSISVMTEDVPALRAIGMTRRDIAAGTVLAHLPAVGLAAALGPAVAVALSPVFPIGEGRRVDPDVGVHADWVVVAIGLLVLILVLVPVAALVGHRAGADAAKRTRLRPSAIAVWLRRRAPLTVGLGAHLALEQGAGVRAVSGRPALVGTALGVLGVVAALTIDNAITDALVNPQRVGVTWAVEIALPSVSPELVAQVQRAAPGATVAIARREVIDVGGVGVPAYALRGAAAPAGKIVLASFSGRPPNRAGEADIGPATARQLHVHVGQWVTVAGAHRVHLVGEALFPTDVHSEFDEGLWLTPAGLDAIISPSTADAAPGTAVVVRFPDRRGQEQSALRVAVMAQAIQSLPPGPNPDARLIAALGRAQLLAWLQRNAAVDSTRVDQPPERGASAHHPRNQPGSPCPRRPQLRARRHRPSPTARLRSSEGHWFGHRGVAIRRLRPGHGDRGRWIGGRRSPRVGGGSDRLARGVEPRPPRLRFACLERGHRNYRAGVSCCRSSRGGLAGPSDFPGPSRRRTADRIARI